MDNQNHDETTDNPFHPALVQKILLSGIVDSSEAKMSARFTDEALVAAGEVLRLFVLEAWHRASIEAECDHEATVNSNENDALNSVSSVPGSSRNVPIRPDHITKIAAELLMDFS